jgi:hypothetical protein
MLACLARCLLVQGGDEEGLRGAEPHSDAAYAAQYEELREAEEIARAREQYNCGLGSGVGGVQTQLASPPMFGDANDDALCEAEMAHRQRQDVYGLGGVGSQANHRWGWDRRS